MHVLEVIVVRNAEAAGRELAHAALDCDEKTYDAIESAHQEEPYFRKAANAFHNAYSAALNAE